MLRLILDSACSIDDTAKPTLTESLGTDIFIDCSGKTASYELAIPALKIGGTLLAIGEGARYPYNSSEIIHKHLTIVGSLYSTMEDVKEVQELMVKGEIDPLAIVSHTFPLEEIPATFEKVIKVSDGMLKSVVVR